MIDTLNAIVKMTIAILPFMIVCFLSSKVNLNRVERSRQFPVVILTIVYTFVAMCAFQALNEALLKWIDGIPGWFIKCGGNSDLPMLLRNLFLYIGDRLGEHFAGFDFAGYWVYFISNLLILLVYLLIKKIALMVIHRTVKSEGAFHTRVAGLFYEYFPERSTWCLKDNCSQVRSLLKVFYFGAIIVSSVLMLVSRWFYDASLVATLFYPVFGIMIVGELFFYLDGLTRPEYLTSILGEDEDVYRTVNYTLLRKFLRTLFGDKLLSENTGVNNALSYQVTTDEILRELEVDEDPKVVTFATFYDGLHRAGFSIDHNYLYSSLDLLNGKSVLFNNPFYNDLIPYAFYPMNRCLLQHKKVLIIPGRHAVEEDIVSWLERGVSSVTNVPFMWRIGILGRTDEEPDIAIMTRSDVLNAAVHREYEELFDKVGFVVILEPSKLISTAQIGLSLIARKCAADGKEPPVYCLCDKNCDGLVDAMSHILLTDLSEVSATKKHLGTCSYMCWDTDSEYWHHRLLPNISRYLGIGTELSFAALKNQVSTAKWYAGEAFPVADMRWIVDQYYYDLAKYAGLPTNQEALEKSCVMSSNFWSATVDKNNYFTVEDEANNMFEILRGFSTRSTEQGFVNVISSDYLLKDYMADNASIFEADAKAIPYITADFTRSHRNTVMRLLLMMSYTQVSEEILSKELSLLGVSVYDLKNQLWYEIYRCYASIEEVASLSDDYREAVAQTAGRAIRFGEESFTSNVLFSRDAFHMKKGVLEKVFTVKDKTFCDCCIAPLRSAGYIAEDEKGQTYYLGAELSGHIYQKYLPGQFFTFGGKYYEMQYLTADGQVLVRRAADHIYGRPSYRQLRRYTFGGVRASDVIGSAKSIAGFTVVKEFADIAVDTDGYYLMERYHDFASAKEVSFKGQKAKVPTRLYRNKEYLRIELPTPASGLSDSVRYTLTVLLNEVFRTLFAENQAFICALTDDSFLQGEERAPLTYSLGAENCEISRNAIYIVEDSQLDLGLIVAVERHMDRIFKIIQDYLDWHMQAVENSLNPPCEPKSPIVFGVPEQVADGEEESPENKKGLAKLWPSIKQWFARWKKRKPDKTGPAPTDTVDPVEESAGSVEEPAATVEDMISAPETVEEEPTAPEETETIIPDLPMMSSSTKRRMSEAQKITEYGFTTLRAPYHERYYLLFGFDTERAYIDPRGTWQYLQDVSMVSNALRQARDSKHIAAMVEATFRPGKANARYCDFCGTEIYGVEYETLADGRDRCLACSRTAIKTGKEFRKIFEDVKRNMESFFGIKIHVGIRVQMVNSKTLHKKLGKTFIPTGDMDGRVLGVAIRDKSGFSLLVENGSPRMASMLTMAHELTHIWQYVHWNEKAIRRRYGRAMELEIYEGMAKWVEIQYAYLINEPAVAKREEIITSYRDDEYGRGFLRYRANYPFSQGTVITKPTPFLNLEEPLDPAYCGAITVRRPEDVNDDPDDTPTPPFGDGIVPSDPIKGPVKRNPSTLVWYAYEQLTEEEKTVYSALLTAIEDHVQTVEPLPSSLVKERVQTILRYIGYDHPEIFWFRGAASMTYDRQSQMVNRVDITYCLSAEESKKRREQIDVAVKSFMTGIRRTMSDYETVLRLYENLIRLIDYDSQALDAEEPTETQPDDIRSLYGALVNKRAVCAGYAKATQYLLQLCGIECTYITSETHAWNLVKLEDAYYHLDTTWGDGSDTAADKPQTDAVGYDCFLITSEELARLEEHTPVGDLPLPVCTATACNYHHRHGLYLDTYEEDRVRYIVCEALRRGRMDVSFKFGSDTAYREAVDSLIENGRMGELLLYSNLKSENRVDTGYQYRVNDSRRTLSFYFQIY